MLLYNLAIHCYSTLARLAALKSSKVRAMVKGQQETLETLRKGIEPGRKYLWFHAASLGEFEQGRPLMERIRQEHPELGILLTFFSPSGYEVRKNYKGADVVCYLPFDTPGNARAFLDAARPHMAFFIKYEFWKNYLDELRRRGIPCYSISSIFRPSQSFFKWYGGTMRGILRDFDHLFVQDEASRKLLEGIGIKNATVVGDTRFDQVLSIREKALRLEIADSFSERPGAIMVAGSSWQPDEDLLIEYFNAHEDLRLIIAPHVISEDHLQEIISKLRRPYVRYTQTDPDSAAKADCLIIDCFGLLSSIYHYGQIAYVGGGFGVGIHNTLEAAVWGIPVIFGPKYQKFREAIELRECGGGFSISSLEELHQVLDQLTGNDQLLKESGQKAGKYVESKLGASIRILESIRM